MGMRFCNLHWGLLRDAIEDVGLWGLVPKSGREATERVAAAHAGDKTLKSFDPLMWAHNAIIDRVLRARGAAAFRDNSDGTPRCPVCFFGQTEQRGQRFDVIAQEELINTAAADARSAYDEMVAREAH